MSAYNLNVNECARYAQQLNLSEVGLLGQTKLKAARVLCVGAGGLGSPLLLYLAAAGVGTLGIVDDDALELSNLQRQVLYTTNQLGQKKANLAKEKLNALNPDINVHIYVQRLSVDNAAELINQYDIVADCSDNFATRYWINDFCIQLNKPFVSASIRQFQGQCSLFLGGGAPCYRCLFPMPPKSELIPSCAEGGVLGVLPGLLGTIQANEILKWILQLDSLLVGKLLCVDLLKMEFSSINFKQNPECECCALKKSINELLPKENACVDSLSISAESLKKLSSDQVEFVLLDVRSPEEHESYNIGGLLIPLPELPHRLHELNSNSLIITYCRTGPRSLQAVKILQQAGFNSLRYLEGGVSGL